MSIVYQILLSHAFSYIFQGSPGRPGASGPTGLKGEKGDPGELPFSLTVMYAAHYWSQTDLCHFFISQIQLENIPHLLSKTIYTNLCFNCISTVFQLIT